jgi:hypothetical protein
MLNAPYCTSCRYTCMSKGYSTRCSSTCKHGRTAAGQAARQSLLSNSCSRQERESYLQDVTETVYLYGSFSCTILDYCCWCCWSAAAWQESFSNHATLTLTL